MDKFSNGSGCAVGNDWEEHTKKTDELTDGMWKLNLGVAQMQQLLDHMDQLPVIAGALTEIKDKLIGVATSGKDESLMKIFMKVISVMSLVIIGLLAVIGLLLVGEKFGLIEHLIR